MVINPEIGEAYALKGWFVAVGNDTSFQSHSAVSSLGAGSINRSEMRSLNEVKEAQLGMSDKVDFFSCRATVMHIKTENMSYPACRGEGCSKKVVEGPSGWRCEKCDKSFDKPEYRFVLFKLIRSPKADLFRRYIISLAAADYSGQAWLQGFNDVGLAIFGISADDLHEIKVRLQQLVLLPLNNIGDRSEMTLNSTR